MAHSVSLSASLRGVLKLLKCFALYLLIRATADSRPSLTGILTGCMIGLALVAGDGVWQVVTGQDLFYHRQPDYALDGQVERALATFHHPASFAIHLATFAPLLCAWGLLGPRRWRAPCLGACGVVAAAVLLARSRGGLLAFLCALVVLAWWLRRWTPLLVALITAGVQAATVPPAVKAWATTMPTLLEQLTQPDRLSYWQAAINMVSAHPFLGVGINTFVKAYPFYRVAGDPFAEIGPYAHNQYLHLAAELGWPGLAVFVVLVALVLLAVRRRLAARAAAPYEAFVSAGLGAGLVGYLVDGLFESSLFYARGSITFWFLVGLIMATDALGSRAAPPP